MQINSTEKVCLCFGFHNKRNFELQFFSQPFQIRVHANETESRNVNKFVMWKQGNKNRIFTIQDIFI